MLVTHDAIEPHLIGQCILLVVLVVQYMSLLGIEVGVRKAHTSRRIGRNGIVSDMAVGLLREPIDLYLIMGSG